MKITKFTKKNVRDSFVRIIEDCDKCVDKDTIKANVIMEMKWLGYKVRR